MKVVRAFTQVKIGCSDTFLTLEKIRGSPRFQSLSAFTVIYGIGPHTARKLYAQGMRTIDDLKDYYGQAREGEGSELIDGPGDGNRKTDTESQKRFITVTLTLMDDFNEK